MTTVNDFSGNYLLSPDFPAGYGQLISNPAQKLTDMKTNNLYFMEASLDSDNLLVNVEGYLLHGFKTLAFQKVMANYVFRMTSLGGQNKIRAVHRSLSLSLSLGAAFRSCGENVQIPDDFSDITALNTALAQLFVQVFPAP